MSDSRNKTCYSIKGRQTFVADELFPCGDTASCCGARDVCLEGSICHWTYSSSVWPGTSSYYIGGCTDENFDDPACSRQCSEFNTLDVVYNANSNLWACCYQDEETMVKNCSQPGDQTFQEPAPSQLSTITNVASLSPSTETSSSGLPSSSTSSPPTLPTPATSNSAVITSTPQSDSLSGGAKAGIAIVAVVGGIGIIAAILFYIRYQRLRKRQQAQQPAWQNKESSPAWQQNEYPPMYQTQPQIHHELGEERIAEAGGQARVELGGMDRSRST